MAEAEKEQNPAKRPGRAESPNPATRVDEASGTQTKEAALSSSPTRPLSSKAEKTAEERERLQYRQIHLLACNRGIFQMARICMGPLAVSMAAEYGWNQEDKGRILSAFAAGYALTQVLGGLASDKFGGKPLLLLGLVTSGGALLVLPFSADLGVAPLWWLLWIMGVLQGPTYPAQLVTTAKWATGSLRSYASALGGTGSTAGSLLALGLSPGMAERIGWRATVAFFGLVTLLFSVLELVRGESAPSWEVSARPDPAETTMDWRSKLRVWRKVLLAPPVLAVFAAHATHNFVRYFLMAWMPTYYREVLGVSADAAGFHLIIPEFCGLVCSMVGAKFGKELQEKGVLSPLSSRRLFVSLAFIGSFVGLFLIQMVTAPAAVTFLLCIVQGLATLQGLGFGANYLDVSKYNGGLVTGVGNTVATCASFLAPMFASSLLPNDGAKGPETWQRLFLAFAISNLLGLALYLPFSSATPVDVDKEEKTK